MPAATIDDARRVKERAKTLASNVTRVMGVGVTKVDGAYAVKVNVQEESAEVRKLPRKIDGVKVVYAVVGEIKPRG